MTKGEMHFKSKQKYRNWLKAGHSKGVFESTPGNQKVFIGGRRHKVKHKRK